jgi:hypothetical protein
LRLVGVHKDFARLFTLPVPLAPVPPHSPP